MDTNAEALSEQHSLLRVTVVALVAFGWRGRSKSCQSVCLQYVHVTVAVQEQKAVKRKVAPAAQAKNARKLLVYNKKQVAERAPGPRATTAAVKEGGRKGSKKIPVVQRQTPFLFRDPSATTKQKTHNATNPRTRSILLNLSALFVLQFQTSPPFFTGFSYPQLPAAMALARSASVPGGLSINTGAANLL